MTPTLPTPAEELEIRQYSEEAWRLTWANCTELSPKQAFIEGHYLAFWCGIMACRKTRLGAIGCATDWRDQARRATAWH
jgi:hypothetical protein